MFTDIHAHMTDERLYPMAKRIVEEMQADGIRKIVNVGYDRESSVESVVLSRKYKGLYAAVGIHPHDARLATRTDYDYFKSFAKDPKVIAIGEIGLDFYYDKSDRATQEKVFIEQLILADELKLPVVIHLRDAYELMLNLLKEHKEYLKLGGLLHCYSGSKEMLPAYLDLGLYVSYGGAVTFQNAETRREVVKATPLDKMMLETDCPYMTPHPHRGKTNEPKFVNIVAEKVAELKQISIEELAEITNRNAETLFPKLKNE